ncbi:terpene synthase family protein [Bacillus pumilus]|uniref:terpene synthase family protein n=1 Tax=Bacillus TaxID=1386 RepID=UPI0030FABE87
MLEVKKIPKIEECFEGSIHPFVQRVHEDTVNWAKMNNLMNDSNLKRYERQKISYLAGRSQPYDSYDSVRLSSDYLLLFCILDDYSDNLNNQKLYDIYSKKIIEILNERAFYDDDTFLYAWHDWWKRLSIGMPDEWKKRIIQSIQNCFNSIKWEIKNEKEKYIPTLEEYVNHRMHSGSVFVCFDLIERGGRSFIPASSRSILLRNLINSINKIVNWTNDLLSFKKEFENDEIHNLVIILQKQENCSIETALDRAKEMLNIEINTFIELKNKVFISNEPFDSGMIKFISRLENGVRGHYEWSMKTKRF